MEWFTGKTIIAVKDLNGNLLGYEKAYSAQGYDLGQEGFKPDDSFGWGIAKVTLETKISDADKHLGIPVFSGTALNALWPALPSAIQLCKAYAL